MNSRVLRASVSITLSLTGMGLVAYGFGQLTHTEWVWWLAPLTVVLDASLFRARLNGSAPSLSPSGLPIFHDPGAPIYLVSSVVAAGVAAWGAYTGNRPALIVGATFAILGRAWERGREPAFEPEDERAERAHATDRRGVQGSHRNPALSSRKAGAPTRASRRPRAVERSR